MDSLKKGPLVCLHRRRTEFGSKQKLESIKKGNESEGAETFPFLEPLPSPELPSLPNLVEPLPPAPFQFLQSPESIPALPKPLPERFPESFYPRFSQENEGKLDRQRPQKPSKPEITEVKKSQDRDLTACDLVSLQEHPTNPELTTKIEALLEPANSVEAAESLSPLLFF